jgi:predicted acetyltransferase
MPHLIAPTTRLYDSWIASRDEWGRGVNQDGAGLGADDDVDTAQGFSVWVQELRQQSDTSIPAKEGRVHATYWWIVEDDIYLGAISLRHTLNDFLLRAGGHIGYGVRPTARRRGLATCALQAVLPEARSLGLTRVLLTCNDNNLGSARIIENSGGVLEDVRDTELGRTRRYWMTL